MQDQQFFTGYHLCISKYSNSHVALLKINHLYPAIKSLNYDEDNSEENRVLKKTKNILTECDQFVWLRHCKEQSSKFICCFYIEVFGLWDDARIPGENPCMHTERPQP